MKELPTEDEPMRGLLAAFYMCGGKVPRQIQDPKDAVDLYVGTVPPGYHLIGDAEDAGYIETTVGGPDYEDGYFVVTEKGREFFLAGGGDADI